MTEVRRGELFLLGKATKAGNINFSYLQKKYSFNFLVNIYFTVFEGKINLTKTMFHTSN